MAAAGATLEHIEHGSLVQARFSLPELQAPALVARLNEAGQGRLGWLEGLPTGLPD